MPPLLMALWSDQYLMESLLTRHITGRKDAVVKLKVGGGTLHFFPSLTLPFLPQSSPLLFPSPHIPLEVGPFQLRVLGERCNLCKRGLGGAPSEIVFGAFKP